MVIVNGASFSTRAPHKMTREYFASLEPRPDDPILGLVELYKNDPRDTKVNLGVGIYLDNEGRLPLMKAVGAAEQRLAKRGSLKCILINLYIIIIRYACLFFLLYHL